MVFRLSQVDFATDFPLVVWNTDNHGPSRSKSW